ncbi:MAG TPA: hypothetical protein VJL61_02115 [Rhodanobacteraceae bacterium]|nr:hypothetical protein [Rhodanobacteraceae bacterium]
MPEQPDAFRAELSALRDEVERLRRELAELREYIGEVPCMECGITSFEEWQKDR